MGLLAMYKRDAKKIHEKYKDKPKKVPEPKPEVPPKEMGRFQTIFWSIVAYWVIFAGVVHWLSGDNEFSSTTFWAPVLLPVLWIWSILSSKTFQYIAAAIFALWWFQKLIIEPIHQKLDQIIEILRGRGY